MNPPPIHAFIHVPKTAGSTVRAVLRREFGTRHCDVKVPRHLRHGHRWVDAEILRRARRVYPRLESVCGHRVTAFNGLQNAMPMLRFYTFVRHPVDRCISHFYHACRADPSQATTARLEAFCRDPWQRNVQTRWLGGSPDPQQAIRMLETQIGFVGLTETFEASMLMLARWLGRPAFNPAHRRVNARSGPVPLPVHDVRRLRAMVEEANHADLAVYSYARDVVFPRQLAAYAGDLERDIEDLRAACAALGPTCEGLLPRAKRNLLFKPLMHLGV